MLSKKPPHTADWTKLYLHIEEEKNILELDDLLAHRGKMLIFHMWSQELSSKGLEEYLIRGSYSCQLIKD